MLGNFILVMPLAWSFIVVTGMFVRAEAFLRESPFLTFATAKS
jgi:hypothetical protein